MAADESSLAAYIVYSEDWVGGEPVTVINTVLPNNVTSLTVSDIRATTVYLSWTASTSADVAGYDIMNGPNLIGTTAGTAYQVTGLTEESTYTFTVKTRNAAGNTASGVSITVTTVKLAYALSMNGTSDYILTPTLPFDTVTLDFMAEQKAGAFNAYVDASRGIPNSLFLRNSSGFDVLQAAWKSVTVDGVNQTGSAGSTVIVPKNQRTVVQLALPNAGKAPVLIFANQLGQIPMKGLLYSVKFSLGGTLTASYDFTKPFSGTAVPDQSGSNNTATLKGGTWVSQ
ncbi:fibronectin type III domain-containing protein [Paenibacillus rigui]|uniref:Fibronectin type-III domain-containing protein n=1 Tax=Paenibacillus rigui TaxID=554312 RepID=A0A229UQP7_9BACL|nr:fibronectin type III domain-containing protein [Paenibacillus rigui]OXM85199.1 hypothetical protein CF651_16505 [Paenibacillus rigui]